MPFLQAAGTAGSMPADARPLVWLGDLNVSATDADVSDSKFFAAQTSSGEQVAADPEDRGQPGFTRSERRRFADLLRRGELHDSFRLLHPDARAFSWQGHPGNAMVGRYRGKGMRLDYCLVTPELAARVAEAGVRAHDSAFSAAQVLERDRAIFLGSDHCPVTLVLREAAVLQAADPERPEHAQEAAASAGAGGEEAHCQPTPAVAAEPECTDDYQTSERDGGWSDDDDDDGVFSNEGEADRPWH